MKTAKKLASLLLALVMVLSLATTAFAATVHLPSDKVLENHTFAAYQVFAGDYSKGVLSNVTWGTGINNENDAFLNAVKGDTTYGNMFTECTSAADVAKVLSDNNTNKELANWFAEQAYARKTGAGQALTAGDNMVADGYYLIVDTTTNVAGGSALNKALLQVVGSINITVKTDAPSVEKKVNEDDKNFDGGEYGDKYNDVADYNIGEAVPFHLIGRVPDMSQYDTYKYTFTDTLSTGLTAPVGSAIQVWLSSDKKVDAGDTNVTSEFNITVNGQTITVATDNLKSIDSIAKDNYIIVEYSATLNGNAVIGVGGNTNEVKLTYSSDPNNSGNGENHPTNDTPKDEVIVFTYELDTTKVDGANEETKLKDAEFVLLSSDQRKVATVEDGKLTGWVDYPTAGEDGTITWPATTILKSDDNGLFKVAGLDDGTYYLKEIKAPAGYNLLAEPVKVEIKAATSNGQNWNGVANSALTNLEVTAGNKTGTGDVSTGIAGITIANNKGSTLPETGGMGTTIFYVLGSILAIGAVVLLVTKKRMSANA